MSFETLHYQERREGMVLPRISQRTRIKDREQEHSRETACSNVAAAEDGRAPVFGEHTRTMANAFKKSSHAGAYNRLIFKTHAQIEKHALTIAQGFSGIARRVRITQNELQTAAE